MERSLDRRSIRLPNFDYSAPNWYFVTVCTYERANLLGKIVGNKNFLSPLGHIANWEILKLRTRFPQIELDEYVIMPNHVHLIFGIRATVKVAPTLGRIIGAYKSRVVYESVSLANIQDNRLGKVWQRNYYEHIIRDNNDLERIRKYIRNNPANWTKDKLNSQFA